MSDIREAAAKIAEQDFRSDLAKEYNHNPDWHLHGQRIAKSIRALPIPYPDTVIPMILHCPKCHLQHIDAPDERTPDWTNPPHKSHLCHGCGCIWRPCNQPTEGVEKIATRGKSDTWPEDGAGQTVTSNYPEAPTDTVRDALTKAAVVFREKARRYQQQIDDNYVEQTLDEHGRRLFALATRNRELAELMEAALRLTGGEG
jgi:hypothetical protein